MSVSQILQQMAENAARARFERGAILGQTVAGLSHIPGQYFAGRDQARLEAEQLGRERQTYAMRLRADQREEAAAIEEQQQRRIALEVARAYHAGTPNDPLTNNLEAGIAKARELGADNLIEGLQKLHAEELQRAQPKITQTDPTHDTYRNGVLIKPGVPAAAKPAAPPNVGSFEDYVLRGATALGKPVEALTPTDIEGFRKKYQQADDRPRITVNTGPTANIPGNWDVTGEEFLKSIPPQWRQTVKKIAAYEEDPTKVASMRGGMREALMQWVNQVNPGYRADEFANRAPTRKAFTIGTQGQQINAINTAMGHIDQLTTLAADMNTGDFVPGNRAFNALRSMFGSEKVTNFETLKDALAGEVASVLSKGAATVSGIAEAREKINSANSPAQLAGYVKTLIPVMGSKLASLDYQYHQAMGADDSFSALSPESKAILTKHGFDPTHPTIAPGAGSGAAAGARVRVIGPNGEKGTMLASEPLPPGWRKQ